MSAAARHFTSIAERRNVPVKKSPGAARPGERRHPIGTSGSISFKRSASPGGSP